MSFQRQIRPERSHIYHIAHVDFIRGVLAWRLWFGLGLHDIRIRYKRTLLGPWWITASQTATFVCLGMLFSAVLKNDVRIYLPQLAAGIVTWTFISAVAGDGAHIFVGSRQIITSMPIPLVVHVLRCSVRNLLIFLHNFSAAVAAYLLLGGKFTEASLLLLLGIPLLFVTLSAGGLLLAIVGARFRDVGPVIGIVTQLMFFMTPIMWRPEDLPNGSKWWVSINPAYHLIEMVRAPMLGGMPTALSIEVSLALAAGMVLSAYLMFCALRHRISYWL